MPTKDYDIKHSRLTTLWLKLSLYVYKYLFTLLFFTGNLYLFWYTYLMYKESPEFFYLRRILGRGLCVSRGSATVLNINCGLILMLMSKHFSSLVSKIINRCISKQLCVKWCSNQIYIHVLLGHTIFIASVVHTVAHLVNAYYFSSKYDKSHPDINWASYSNENPIKFVTNTVTGVTGICMLVIIFILTFSAVQKFRTLKYNWFLYIHHLTVVYFLLLLIHPLSDVLKKQSNLNTHTPGCYKFSDTNVPCSEEARFQHISTKGWLWVFIPLLLYILDTAVRICRRNKSKVEILDANMIHDAVHITISLPHPLFTFEPGQFVLLQDPSISKFEWHPFTIISSPTQSELSFELLVRNRGDWSFQFYDRYKHFTRVASCRRISIDGPYYSVMENVLHSEMSVCIAAGIGITSFMSTLSYLVKHETTLPKRLHLVWVIRHKKQLDYCDEWLTKLHDHFWKNNEVDRFSLQIYITGRNHDTTSEPSSSCILSPRIHFGRPKWKYIFRVQKELNPEIKQDVYVCGPKSLVEEIATSCQRVSKSKFNVISEGFY